MSSRFHSLVELTISNSFLVGNCFLNFSSICSVNLAKSSVSSSMKPRVYLVKECSTSRQWILSPCEDLMQEFFVYSEYISCSHSRFACHLQYLPSATIILKSWGLYFLKSRTLAIGRSKETMARVFGLGIPSGGSKLPMKSDIWLNVMNCVACGSNLYIMKCLNCIVRRQDQEIKE